MLGADEEYFPESGNLSARSQKGQKADGVASTHMATEKVPASHEKVTRSPAALDEASEQTSPMSPPLRCDQTGISKLYMRTSGSDGQLRHNIARG